MRVCVCAWVCVSVTGISLILERDITEQIRHRLLVVNAAYGLGNQNRYIDGLYLVALQLLNLMWNGIGDNNLKARNRN